MILTDIDDSTQTGVIILRPNSSWSWRANVIFLCVFMAVSLTIGFGFLLAGAWVVLPYSLLEISVVGGCIYHCVRQCARQEVITVSDHEVTVETGINKISNARTYQRMWARFFVTQPNRPWQSLTLSIRSHGQETEIGSFLNEQDKDNLVSQLKRVVPA